MLSALPDMPPAVKRLIDDGYALPFGEALALERERSHTHRAQVTGLQLLSASVAFWRGGRRSRIADPASRYSSASDTGSG
jgi:enoyl-CoA hydratase